MGQLGLDFNNNVNQRIYTDAENQLIDQLVLDYKEMKNRVQDDSILIQLFFEFFCTEIITRLKSDRYFEGSWSFLENDFANIFYNFIITKPILDESLIVEFLMKLINEQEINISATIWRNNDVKKFDFDRKITEGIINLIIDDKINKAVLAFIAYVKIWNFFRIYNRPFNNNKALLIYRIFADKLWPRKDISFDIFSKFDQAAYSILNSFHNKIIYCPFFDEANNDFYSENYLIERSMFHSNINTLFEFDYTDENESYAGLIDNLLNSSSEEIKNKQKILIKIKIEKSMYPTKKDIEFFSVLYDGIKYKDIGKWLLSKFYLYDKLSF